LKAAKNILITGRPRVGKTTLIRLLAEKLGGLAGGFYTEEVPGEGVRGRRGFRIVTLDGRIGTLADVCIESGPHVGKYGVNLKELEAVGVAAIEEAVRDREWIVIDEIGKMEEYSRRFCQAVTSVLDSERRVLATIRRNDSPFTAGIKSRPDVGLFTLTVPDRDAMTSELLEIIGVST